MIDSSTRVLRAVSYIEFALRNIDKKTYISAWCRNCAIYSMKNARTLLENTKQEYLKEARLTRVQEESTKLLKELIALGKERKV